MQWVASGFLFVRGQSIIHRIDPRVRLLMALSLFAVALISHSLTELIVLISIIVSLTVVSKITRRFAKSMTFTAGISIVAFLVNFFIYPSSVENALIFGLRLFAVISSTSIFFLTSTPDELEHVMKWLRLPADFVMVFVIAVRFVPVLLLDALQIMDAQRARGLEFDKGSIFRRLRNTIPLLVPLIAVALNRSLDLAEAMDSRAYGAFRKTTSMDTLKLRGGDYFALCIAILGMIVGVSVAALVNLI